MKHMVDMKVLEQLQVFRDNRTLRKTASLLHMSQPALSQSMKRLEEELGIPLFERWGNNRIALNENGRQLAAYADEAMELRRKIYGFAEEVREQMQESQNEQPDQTQLK